MLIIKILISIVGIGLAVWSRIQRDKQIEIGGMLAVFIWFF